MKYLAKTRMDELLSTFNTLTKKECRVVWNPIIQIFTFEVIKEGEVSLICYLMEPTKGETETILIEKMGSIKDVGLIAYKKEILEVLEISKIINKEK